VKLRLLNGDIIQIVPYEKKKVKCPICHKYVEPDWITDTHIEVVSPCKKVRKIAAKMAACCASIFLEEGEKK
jgi:hypothetical protein